MGSRSFVSMNIAIIGNCRNTAITAERLARAGHKVFMGIRRDEPDDLRFTEYLENIYYDTIEDAAEIADLIIISAPADTVREIAYRLGDVRKKIIIDISGNVSPRPDQYVYTVRATRSITGAEHVIKAFTCTPDDETTPFTALASGDLFLAGDSKKAKALMTVMAADFGFEHVFDFGDQSTIPMLEDMARCWRNLAINQKMGQKIAFKLVMR